MLRRSQKLDCARTCAGVGKNLLPRFRVINIALSFQPLEPQTKSAALPIEDLDLATAAIEEYEQPGIEHFHFNIQLD